MMANMQGNSLEEDPEMRQLNGLMQSILDIQHPETVAARLKQSDYLYPDSQFRAIPAIISGNQKVVDGATVKLQIKDTVLLSGQLIPKGQFIFGKCRIINQRLLLEISTIRMDTSIVPVDLTVYSLDGMPGIAAPDAELSNALNDGTQDAAQNIQLMGLDPSMGLQVASAGLDAAKSLLRKKLRNVKVKLKNGQQLLLRNNQINSFIYR